MSPVKACAFLTGAFILVAINYNQATLNPANAVLLWSLCAGMIVGSIVVVHAFNQGQTKQAFAVVCMLIAGEVYTLSTTATQNIIARNEASKPLATANKSYSDAVDRLSKSVERKSEADKQVVENAAKKDCRVSCAAMLSEAAQNAAKEVTEARKRMDGIQLPSGTASPLATFLGINSTTLDVILSALASFASAGLATCLISYGSSSAINTVSNENSVAQFLLATLKPDQGESIPSTLLESKYIAWTIETQTKPLPYDVFTKTLSGLLLASGLSINADAIENVSLR
jgi:hypothetical protein